MDIILSMKYILEPEGYNTLISLKDIVNKIFILLDGLFSNFHKKLYSSV